MESKYAIAQISIPIEIFTDGEWINHNDRIQINIIETPNLPPISTINNENLMQTIHNILKTENVLSEKISMSVYKETPLPFIINVQNENNQKREQEDILNSKCSQIPIEHFSEESIIKTELINAVKPTTNLTNGVDSQHLRSWTNKEINPIPKGYDYNIRRFRTPSKNTSFKKTPIKSYHKTRSNRYQFSSNT